MQISSFAIIIALVNLNPPEQIALDYFTKEILSNNYPKTKHVYFSGHSEAKQIVTVPFNQCFDLKSSKKAFYNQNDSLPDTINLSFNKAVIRKAPNIKAHGLNILISSAVKDGNSFYTYIQVYKPNYFIDHYLVKISSSTGEVVGTCRISETI